MSLNIIQRMTEKMVRYTGTHHLYLSFWGNDVQDALLYNYDFYNYSDSFFATSDTEYEVANIFLIVGPINLNQLNQLKKRLNKDQMENKFVVHLKGSLQGDEVKNSYMLCDDLAGHIKVDLEYSKYPFDIEDVLSQIVSLQDCKNDE
ncbi:MAG: hypothetical protein HON90_01950 [Halobacteriovoraceae bacterium]|jgi:hypothetical protein|nr:hypothetical protein [Halobacteriovoraceae bacterium]